MHTRGGVGMFGGAGNNLTLLNGRITGGLLGAGAITQAEYNQRQMPTTTAGTYTADSFMIVSSRNIANTSLELAYGQTERIIHWVRSDGGEQVFVDTNGTLPNGNPNPNAGRYYVQRNNRVQVRRSWDGSSGSRRATPSISVGPVRGSGTTAWGSSEFLLHRGRQLVILLRTGSAATSSP